ncbi:ThiF family adenylyltransferase [Bartonella machadoae]|uniref:ThiF family adenylyltransferase n=1 Tax=Bartonella machadoae TaxID=2893471 RepID=UPI001F4CADB3|nr:ThiF family adenylyltransferase [Bartonella machadoae]UNE55470.1 ThiF family adenylyltransferase [Bartonella machadoae]
MLASSGVEKLILVDNDVIKITNLTGQILFTKQDVGFPKTTVLRRELIQRNSQSEVSELQMLITVKEDIIKFPKADLWLISSDEPDHLVPWINKQAYRDSGTVNDIAVFGLFYIPRKPVTMYTVH